MQPVTRSLSLTITAGAPCFHNDKNLDLILVVDCATSNPAFLGLMKTQLNHLVTAIFKKGFHLRLALVSYQNHQKHSPFGTRHRNPNINNTVYTQKLY
ncbi:hypothetical protein OS493_011287 [Desmophyllum pertusum]|uniref:VWFA domain-containing protein n=1 Tax=Desmophyllum pertusum TaxID=174260 RepID=A0A9X0CTJ1_9CNID|nr:hypothetical protein OS493_011287 [Desmophyllum pertusum]